MPRIMPTAIAVIPCIDAISIFPPDLIMMCCVKKIGTSDLRERG
jgi:hypothetical protein